MISRYIKEGNTEVMDLVRQVDKKILELRAANKIPSEYAVPLTEFYQEATLPWMETYYLLDKEVEPEREQEFCNKLLDLLLILRALE